MLSGAKRSIIVSRTNQKNGVWDVCRFDKIGKRNEIKLKMERDFMMEC